MVDGWMSWDQRWLSSHLCLQRDSTSENTTLYTVILTYVHMGIVYSLVGVTE